MASPKLLNLGLFFSVMLLTWFFGASTYRYFRSPFIHKIGITLPELVFDFGSVDPGELVTHKFLLKNNGSKPVKILKILPSCSCMVAQLKKNVVGENEQLEIGVDLNTEGMLGAIEKDVFVLVDFQSKPIVLKMTGDVRSLWTPRTKSIELYYGKNDSKLEKEFQIDLAGKAKQIGLSVKKEELPPYLDILLQHMNDKYNVAINLDCTKAPKRFSDTILLYPSDKHYYPYQLFVEGFWRDGLYSIPDECYFGIIDKRKNYIRKLTIKWRDSTKRMDQNLIKTELQMKYATAAIMIEDNGTLNSADIIIKLVINDNAPLTGKVDGKFLITYGDDDSLSIPITGFLSSGKGFKKVVSE